MDVSKCLDAFLADLLLSDQIAYASHRGSTGTGARQVMASLGLELRMFQQHAAFQHWHVVATKGR